MAIAWALGAATGISALAGFRAFLPMAVFIFMSRMGWAWGFKVQDTPFDFLQSSVAIGILLALVVLEIFFTRAGTLRAVEQTLRLPFAVVAGALLFAATMAGEFPGWEHFLGLPAGALLAALGYYSYRGLTQVGQGNDPGPALDVLVLLLSVTTILLPPAGYTLGVATLWMAVRVRRLRKMKYKGLRVLA